MSTIADAYDYVVGVDTHARTHEFVIVHASTGGVVSAARKYDATAHGFTKAIAWLLRVVAGGRVLAAVEGTGSYGATLTGALTAAGITVTESRPGSKKARRGQGKTDTLDALRAARSVLPRDTAQLGSPRQGQTRSELQVLLTIRRQKAKEKTAKINALGAIVRTLGLLPDTRKKLTLTQIRTIAGGSLTEAGHSPLIAAQAATLATEIIACEKALNANEKLLRTVVLGWRADLLEQPGIGPVTAARILCAWSHPGRLSSEAAFASMAGISPVPIGSGDSLVYRLNYGGDRQLNSAFYTIMMTRKRIDPRTKAYIAKRTAEGKSKRAINRLLKRYIAREVFNLLEHGANTATAADTTRNPAAA